MVLLELTCNKLPMTWCRDRLTNCVGRWTQVNANLILSTTKHTNRSHLDSRGNACNCMVVGLYHAYYNTAEWQSLTPSSTSSFAIPTTKTSAGQNMVSPSADVRQTARTIHPCSNDCHSMLKSLGGCFLIA